MKLFSKHGEQQTVIAKSDFTGGLNTSAQVDGIAENQLADVLNMEIDIATGKLQTVAGTVDILKTENIFAAIYDKINKKILVVKNDKKIYVSDLDGNISQKNLGKLTGELYPKFAQWENGLIIASGGKLQYFNGESLKTLDSSPFLTFNGKNISVVNQNPAADEIFIRNGRVAFANDNKIFYSAIGDENFYLDDANVPQTAKWLEIGYKDGAKIIGVVSLANDVLILKDNNKVYRLAGEYPQWQIAEVGQNFECRSRRSFCKVGEDVFVLGENAYLIQNNFYGTMRAENLSLQIKSEIQKLPKNSPVKFLSSLWQVWILGSDGLVLIFDLRLKSWWKRKFNSEILDVFEVGEDIFIVKQNKISKLDKGTFYDDDKPLQWKFLSQRLVSHHEFLLKRSRVSITPLNHEIYSGKIFVGQVEIALPIPDKTIRIFENQDKIFDNATKISKEGRNRGYILPQPPDGIIFRNVDMIDDNRHKVFANDTFEIICRNVFRNKYLDVRGRGEGGRFILQSIILDVAEV